MKIDLNIKQKKESFIKKIMKFFVYWFKYLTINNFKKFPFDSLFWNIRREIRKKDIFKYWTKYRRKEEGCCQECGTVLDNNKHWERVISFKKRYE